MKSPLKYFKSETDIEDILNDDDFANLEQLARAQQKVEHGLTKWEATKLYPWTVAFIGVALWTMILVGYENQAGGMVLSIPQFREDFGHLYEGSYVLDSQWQSAISGGPVGALSLGLLIGSYFADKIGRKWTLVLATLFGIPFITLEYVATTIEVFFAGKFVNGFALGMLSSCCNTYTSECSPLALRGFFEAALALSLCIGPFVCVLINNTTSTYTTRMAYRGIFIPQWVFSISALFLLLWIPESPYWLISKGRNKKALSSLKRMYKDESLVQKQFALMIVTVRESGEISSQAGTYMDCFKKKDIRRTLLVIFPMFLQAISGVSYVSNYSTYYYQLSGFSTQKSFQISCGAQALSVSGVMSSWFIIDRFGRRPLLLGGIVAITILNLVVACTGLNKNNIRAMEASAGFMAMYNFVYNIAIGPVPYILAGEVSSVFLRSKTYAIGNLINNAFQCMWSFVLPYMFNTDQADMGSKINFIFTGCTVVSFFVVYFYLPETAHRSFEEIDEMFAKNLPPKQWKNYKTDKQIESEKHFEELKITASHDEGKEIDNSSAEELELEV